MQKKRFKHQQLYSTPQSDVHLMQCVLVPPAFLDNWWVSDFSVIPISLVLLFMPDRFKPKPTSTDKFWSSRLDAEFEVVLDTKHGRTYGQNVQDMGIFYGTCQRNIKKKQFWVKSVTTHSCDFTYKVHCNVDCKNLMFLSLAPTSCDTKSGIHNFWIMATQCISTTFMGLSAGSPGFYKEVRICLLRGRNWIFRCNRG